MPKAIDLTQFCAEENRHYWTTEPWVHDGWRYASDSAIVVRVPAVGEPDTPGLDGKIFPNERVDALFAVFPPCESPLPSPEFQECSGCQGTGEVQCRECHTTVACKRCCGRKAVLPEKNLVGPRVISGKYLTLIIDLPDVRVQLDGDPKEPMAFASRDFQGFVAVLIDV